MSIAETVLRSPFCSREILSEIDRWTVFLNVISSIGSIQLDSASVKYGKQLHEVHESVSRYHFNNESFVNSELTTESNRSWSGYIRDTKKKYVLCTPYTHIKIVAQAMLLCRYP